MFLYCVAAKSWKQETCSIVGAFGLSADLSISSLASGAALVGSGDVVDGVAVTAKRGLTW
jgi:hypothetical protein